MIFGVIVSNRGFFPDHLVAQERKNILEKLDSMGHSAVILSPEETHNGQVKTHAEALACATLFRKNADVIEGIVVVLPNFGEETAVAEAIELSGLSVPVLVQGCDDEIDKLAIQDRRDAFCGKLSVCNCLYHRGIKFTNTSQHTCRINSEVFTVDLERFGAICRVVNGLRGARLLAVGSRPSGFQTVRYSEKLLQRSGITVVTVGMTEMIAAANAYRDTDPQVQERLERLRGYGRISAETAPQAVLKQAKLGLALQDRIRQENCQASAVECWDALEYNYGCAPCVSMSMMGEDRMPSACEMDVMGALTMLAMQLAADTPPAYLDWNNNFGEDRDLSVNLHCSAFPKGFFGKAADSIEIGHLDVLSRVVDKDLCFGACKGQVSASPMTFAKVTTDDLNGQIKCYVGEGQFEDEHIPSVGGLALCRVKGLQRLMDYICMHGFEHHVAFSRSLIAGVLAEAFEKYMGWPVHMHSAD